MPLESRFCRRLAADSPYVSVSSVVSAPISSATYCFQVSAVPPGPTSSRRRTSTRVVTLSISTAAIRLHGYGLRD